MNSKAIKIITWNVNSVRKRLPLIMDLLTEEQPDFLFLQETKVVNESFPLIPDYFSYKSGEKGKNGVAILSKHDTCETVEFFHYLGRLVAIKSHGITFASLYMYNGFSQLSPKEKKMAMFDWMREVMQKIDGPLVVGGDFNVVYKPNESSMVNPYEADEIYCFQKWEKLLIDTTPKTKFITWWDYREHSFSYDKGMGLDKFYITPHFDFMPVKILRHFRGKALTSDHAPVKITLCLNSDF